uniref:Uncharacterized protein n=1 Tax=Pararge aegeria TaxID=116150 RepID=S4PS82_9NEOP
MPAGWQPCWKMAGSVGAKVPRRERRQRLPARRYRECRMQNRFRLTLTLHFAIFEAAFRNNKKTCVLTYLRS